MAWECQHQFKHTRSYCCLLEVLNRPELFTLRDCNQCLDTSEEPKQWNGSQTWSISLNWWILFVWDHRSQTEYSTTEATPYSMTAEKWWGITSFCIFYFEGLQKQICIFVQFIFAKSSVDLKSHSFCCDVAIIAPLISAGAEMWIWSSLLRIGKWVCGRAKRTSLRSWLSFSVLISFLQR